MRTRRPWCQTGVPAGIAIAGALLLPLAVWIGWQAAVLATAGVCLLIAIGLQPCRRELDSNRNPRQKLAFGDVKETVYFVLRQPALRSMALAAFVFVGLQAIFTNFTVVYLYEELNYTAVQAGAVLGLTTLVAVPARIFWGVMASTVISARLLLGILKFFWMKQLNRLNAPVKLNGGLQEGSLRSGGDACRIRELPGYSIIQLSAARSCSGSSYRR